MPLRVLEPSHSDFTSTNRWFVVPSGEGGRGGEILPHGILSVAMHDGETDRMLGVMVVSQ